MSLANILTLLRKDITIEIRQKYAIASIILFAICVVFIIYKAFNNITSWEWNVLLWIVLLFAGLNAILKSFVQEKSQTQLYYYSIAHPLEVLFSKLIYNILFLMLLLTIIIGFFSLFIGFPIKDSWLFIQGAMLGCIGIGTVFTFVSAVSSSENQNATLMSILALPLVLPILLILIKVTAVALRLIQDSSTGQDILLLAGIDVLMLGVAILLFPVLWKL